MATSGSPRLSDVLFSGVPIGGFGSLVCMASNVEAIDTGILFSAGLDTHAIIVGPSGWGKSHLLQIVATRIGKQTGRPVAVRTLRDYLASGSRGHCAGPLILDDAHEILHHNRYRGDVSFMLEHRVRMGRPTLMAFTVARPGRSLDGFLADMKKWKVSTIHAPGRDERMDLIPQLAHRHGLMLSTRLARLMGRQLQGNGYTLNGALKRLRLSGADWLSSPATLRACGVLEPFFTDNSNWDLSLKLKRLSEQSRALFPQVSATDLAIATLLQVAGQSEQSVARTFGLEPAEAYGRATRFRMEAARDPGVARALDQFCELAVDSLARD